MRVRAGVVRDCGAMRRRHILLTAVVVAGALCPEAIAAWRAPVDGRVVKTFDYRRSAPFERGAHRGALFAARAGETVGAACSGTVRYAGATPRGHVVTVRCGGLLATHLGLSGVRVAAGARVRVGAPVGRAGSRGVGLGARRPNDRWGYLDPLKLIVSTAPDLGPVPLGRRREPRVPTLEPARLRRHVRAPAPTAAGMPPMLASVGLGLVAATLAGAAGTIVFSVRPLVMRHGPRRTPRGAGAPADR